MIEFERYRYNRSSSLDISFFRNHTWKISCYRQTLKKNMLFCYNYERGCMGNPIPEFVNNPVSRQVPGNLVGPTQRINSIKLIVNFRHESINNTYPTINLRSYWIVDSSKTLNELMLVSSGGRRRLQGGHRRVLANDFKICFNNIKSEMEYQIRSRCGRPDLIGLRPRIYDSQNMELNSNNPIGRYVKENDEITLYISIKNLPSPRSNRLEQSKIDAFAAQCLTYACLTQPRLTTRHLKESYYVWKWNQTYQRYVLYLPCSSLVSIMHLLLFELLHVSRKFQMFQYLLALKNSKS
jgi:hypothetical protein